jgi:nucleoside-diphosphate-sugar epimerase
MKILISGSNGFIGNFLKENFILNGHKVVSIGLSSLNDFEIDLSKEYSNLEGDFDIVIHSAGIVHSEAHSNNLDSNLFVQDVNITNNFLKSIKKINYKKFIHLSSVSIYGLESGENISTRSCIQPNSGYGLSKFVSEKLVESFIPKEKILILRLPLVNGINPKGNIKGVVNAINRGYMVLFKNNLCKKSIMELPDLFNFIANSALEINGIYNIKSYDIFLNDFILSLAGDNKKKIIVVPLFVLKILFFVSNLFFLKNINIKIKKIKNSLTFSSDIII